MNKPYQKPVTPRPSARGTVQLFPQAGSLPPPPRPTTLDAIAVFHLHFDGGMPPGGKS